MQILLVTDGGMEGLEDIMLAQGHSVYRFSIPADIPPTAESVFGTWVESIENSDLIIMDDKLKKKYSDVVRVVNGSALSVSEAMTRLIEFGIKPESFTRNKIVRRRWWSRNGN